MENLASLVLDDKEVIQHSKHHRRHGEEIEGSDYLAVILEKGVPLLTGITVPNHTTQISDHGSFCEGEAQLLAGPRESWARPSRDSPGLDGRSNPSLPG